MFNSYMTPAGKYSLTLGQKRHYNIPPQAESYTFIWDHVSEDQCADMVKFLKDDGFIIVDQKLDDANSPARDFSVTAYRK